MQASVWPSAIRRGAISIVAAGVLAVALVAAAGSAAAAAGKATALHTFVKVVPGLPTSVDPTNFQGRPSSDNLQTFTSPLIRTKGLPRVAAALPGPYAVEPMLATSWTRGQDGSWTFKLRDNAKSPAGNTLTADDVKWSFDRAIALDGVARFLISTGNIDPKTPRSR